MKKLINKMKDKVVHTYYEAVKTYFLIMSYFSLYVLSVFFTSPIAALLFLSMYLAKLRIF